MLLVQFLLTSGAGVFGAVYIDKWHWSLVLLVQFLLISGTGVVGAVFFISGAGVVGAVVIEKWCWCCWCRFY